MEPPNKKKFLTENPSITPEEVDEYERLINKRFYTEEFSTEDTVALDALFKKLLGDKSGGAVIQQQRPTEFATGALIPTELAWQDGKTAGEIRLINFVLLTREHLRTYGGGPGVDPDKEIGLLREANELLKWYEVEE